jgi:hypothetical protein
MFVLTAVQNRTVEFQVTLFESDETTALALAGSDVVRFKLGSGSATPLLDMSSAAPLEGGSSVTIADTDPATVVLRLDQGDLDFFPGTYDGELLVVDAADDNVVKHVEFGVVHVLASMGGAVGLT